MRERNHGSPAARGLIHQEKTTVKAGTRISGDFLGSFGKHPLDLLPQGLSEESLPGTSDTIPGCEIGEEESPGREHGNRPGERSPPRTPLLSPATASSAEPGNPQLSKGESSRQVNFFPAPLPFPPERPEPPEEEEKGALPLRFFLFLPAWPEGEEDDACF